MRTTTIPFFKVLVQPHNAYGLTDEENLSSPFLKKSDQNSSQVKAAAAIGPMIDLTTIAPGTSTLDNEEPYLQLRY